MKKKLVSFMLACVMVIGLAATAGCGSSVKKAAPPTYNYLYNTSEGHKAIGEYLQSALQAAGITMNLSNQEWNTFLNTRKNGEYTVARNGWLADFNDPISFLDMWTTASGNNDVQFGKGAHKDLAMYDLDLTPYGGKNIKNGTWAETYDVLISMIKGETDKTKRYAMMHLAEDQLMETGCITPLYFYTDIYMINKDVKGFYANPLGYKYFSSTQYKDNSSISVCLASEPDTIDPALNSAVDGATLTAHLFAGLAKWSQNEKGALTLAPDVAKSLPDGVVNADGTVTYTYELKDSKWSDGTPVTAADFEYAWKRAASTTLGADYGYMFEVVKGYGEDDVDGLAPLAVKADGNKLTVTLNNAVAYWDELLAFPAYYPVKKDVVANESWATDPKTYVCNGAYVMSGWDHNTLITLKKNPNYFDADKVTMKEIKFFLSDDAQNMLANFQNGSWQLIDDVPNAEIPSLKKNYPGEFVIAGQIGTYYVCWNINESLLPEGSGLTGIEAEKANAEIRKACALLFDRNYIVEEIGQAGQVPASSFVAMGMTDADDNEFYKNAGHNKAFTGYYDVSEEAFEANCKKAMETLQKYYILNK